MEALIFEAVGEPREVLRTADVDVPAASADTALVRVTARPIQPADLAFIQGRYRITPQLPQVAGLEGAGVVINAPPGSGIAPGARVAFRWPGSWADIAAVPTSRLNHIPDDLGDEVACQISLNPLTAWALIEKAGAAKGEWIILTAASSTVASLVASICRTRGIPTVGIVRPGSARARASTDVCLSNNDLNLVEKIKEAVGPQGALALIDSVGGPLTASLMRTLAPGGRIVAYGVQDPAPAEITNAMLIYSNLTWTGFGIDRWLSLVGPEKTTAAYDSLWTLLRSGALSLPVASTWPLADFNKALAADAAPTRQGKVLLWSQSQQ